MADLETAKSAEPARQYVGSEYLEQLTGTPASTWRGWAAKGTYGPPSMLIGRRRVWKLDAVLEWLEEQEAASR